MADKIKTNWQYILTGLFGTSKIIDDEEYDDLKVFSIVPETNTVVNILIHVNPDGEESDATETFENGGRNLTTLKVGTIYLAGVDSYFKKIKLDSGEISINQ